MTLDPGEEDGLAAQTQTLADPDHIRPDLQELRDRQALTRDENRPKAVARRRGRNQRTARENIDDLCQGGDFHEFGQMVYAAQRSVHKREGSLSTAGFSEHSPLDRASGNMGTTRSGKYTEVARVLASSSRAEPGRT